MTLDRGNRLYTGARRKPKCAGRLPGDARHRVHGSRRARGDDGSKNDPIQVPGSNDVVVAATHAGLNPADLAQRAGHYPAPPGSVADIPGLEVAGIVVAVGAAVTDWQLGDRVFGIVGGGGLADRVAVHERHVARVPDRLSDEQAAAVPEAFITAHDAIFTRAGLVTGETLLVNGANGGVGTAAVQLGLAAGARVLANVRSRRCPRAAVGHGRRPGGAGGRARRGGRGARAGRRAEPAGRLPRAADEGAGSSSSARAPARSSTGRCAR